MTHEYTFPPLDLQDWQPTRDTLHLYARLLGQVRRALTPPQKHWWHVSLRVGDDGLTTSAIPAPGRRDAFFSLALDLLEHSLIVAAPQGQQTGFELAGQSPQRLLGLVLTTLQEAGIAPEIDQRPFAQTESRPYDPDQAQTYFSALRAVNHIFQTFKAGLAGETGPVQLWPHHFDLSLEWFSGRAAQLPDGEADGEEQIGFGFSTGDEEIPEAYFYANPWPFPAGILERPLPGTASWYTQSWRGGLLRYRHLTAVTKPAETLHNFLTAVHQHGSALMK